MAKYGNVIGNVLFIAFAVVGMVLSLKLPLGTPLEPMTGFVPLVVSVFLLSVSLIHFFYVIRGDLESVETLGEMWKRPAQVVAGLLLYSFILDPLGYVIATTGLAFVVMRVFEPDAWIKPLAVAIVVSGVSYVLFDRLLDVPLPMGILEGIL
jgi:putative tricarboxylic transport membrane protein